MASSEYNEVSHEYEAAQRELMRRVQERQKASTQSPLSTSREDPRSVPERSGKKRVSVLKAPQDGRHESGEEGRGSESGEKRHDTVTDYGQEAQKPYDGQQVVSGYIEELAPALGNLAHEFETIGAHDLQRQANLLLSMLPVLRENRDLAFPFYVEEKNLYQKLVERRDMSSEAEQLDERSGSGSSGTVASTAIDGNTNKGVWDRLVKVFASKIDPDVLKLIAHLRVVREWSISGDVSADAFFVKGKVGLSITFGK